MKKFLLTFFGGNTALRYDNLDKAEKEAREKHLAAWGVWMAELVKANHLEIGYPLESNGERIDSDGTQDYHFPDTDGGRISRRKSGIARSRRGNRAVVAYH